MSDEANLGRHEIVMEEIGEEPDIVVVLIDGRLEREEGEREGERERERRRGSQLSYEKETVGTE